MDDAAAPGPSLSLTIVGDRAQARHGFTESWQERLERISLTDIRLSTLTRCNYRTPQEVMAEAEPVIRSVLPDANVPTAIRSSGAPRAPRAGGGPRPRSSPTWLAEHSRAKGIAGVIGDPDVRGDARGCGRSPRSWRRASSSTWWSQRSGRVRHRDRGAVDRYVAMTRATQQLVILTS